MSNITLDEWAPLLSREASARRGTLLAMFAGIALLFLLIAFLWQKKYTSFVQLKVDNKTAVEVVAGVKTATETNEANVARETLFSADIMNKVLLETGAISEETAPIERERAKARLMKKTSIHNIENQLLEIVVEDQDPSLAYETAKQFAELFLIKTKERSSGEAGKALDFVAAQVETYRTKLEDAEARLESFSQQYPGITASTEGNVDSRIVELRRQKEAAELQYAEYNARRVAIERQLANESAILASNFRNEQVQNRINGLQAQIDQLSLQYTDDYPEIVSLRDQIRNLRAGGAASLGSLSGPAAGLNPALQTIRTNLASVTREAESQRSKAAQLGAQLKNEISRSAVSNKVEREMLELTRDYEINKSLFEELIRSQENVRISEALSKTEEGRLYNIEQEANFPVLPTGLRFMHIALIGLFLSIALPIAFLILFVKLDPRIRTQSAITDLLELPLLTTVPHMPQPNEKPSLFSRPASVVGVVFLVVALYIIVAIAKYMMALSSQGGV